MECTSLLHRDIDDLFSWRGSSQNGVSVLTRCLKDLRNLKSYIDSVYDPVLTTACLLDESVSLLSDSHRNFRISILSRDPWISFPHINCQRVSFCFSVYFIFPIPYYLWCLSDCRWNSWDMWSELCNGYPKWSNPEGWAPADTRILPIDRQAAWYWN
jgi:hypothetical protein